MGNNLRWAPTIAFLLLFVTTESRYRGRPRPSICRQRKFCHTCRRFCINGRRCRMRCRKYLCGPYTQIRYCFDCKKEAECKRKCQKTVCRVLFFMSMCRRCFNKCNKKHKCRRYRCRRPCRRPRMRSRRRRFLPRIFKSYPCNCLKRSDSGSCVVAYRIYKCWRCTNRCRKVCNCRFYRFIYVNGYRTRFPAYRRCIRPRRCYKYKIITRNGIRMRLRVRRRCNPYKYRNCRLRCSRRICSMRNCTRRCKFPDMPKTLTPDPSPLPSISPSDSIDEEPQLPSVSDSEAPIFSTQLPVEMEGSEVSMNPEVSTESIMDSKPVDSSPSGTVTSISDLKESPETVEFINYTVQASPENPHSTDMPPSLPSSLMVPTPDQEIFISPEPMVEDTTDFVPESTMEVMPTQLPDELTPDPLKKVIKQVRSVNVQNKDTKFVSLSNNGLSPGDIVNLRFYTTPGTVFSIIINEGETKIFALISGLNCPVTTPAPLLMPFGITSVPVTVKLINGSIGFRYSFNAAENLYQVPCQNPALSFEVSLKM